MSNIVLMYHCLYRENGKESGFQNESAFIYKVPVKEFEKQVQAVWSYLDDNHLPKETVEFTFDDGGTSFYTLAAPVLEKYGFKGTFFIATNYIDSPLFMTKNQIRELSERGHIIASHSHSHPDNMAKLDYKQLVKEWNESKSILEEIIGKVVSVASIPNGYGSKTVYKSASDSGIRVLYTSIPTTKQAAFKDVRIIGRYVVLEATTMSDFQRLLTNRFYRFMMKTRFDALTIVRSLLGEKYNSIKTLVLRRKNSL